MRRLARFRAALEYFTRNSSMNQEQEYSEEILNAFVDGHLSLEDRIRVYARLQRNESLNRRVCELCTVRDLVRLAYAIPPKPGM